MVHCPDCDATLESETDVEFADMGAKAGFFEASKRFSGVEDRGARNRETMSGTLERLAAAVEG